MPPRATYKYQSLAQPIDHLLDPDISVRWKTAGALGASTDPEAVTLAMVALGDAEPRVRTAGAESLAELSARGICDVAAIGPLSASLEDPEPLVRAAAARALAELTRASTMSPEAIGPLIAVLDDRYPATRRGATVALGRLGKLGPSARRTVWAALTHKGLADSDGEVRKLAAEALVGLTETKIRHAPDPARDLREALSNLSVAEATDKLVALGKKLRGPPLKRASWELVARALSDVRAGEALLRILAGATAREDALRALRLARKARIHRPAKGRPVPPRPRTEVLEEEYHDALWDDVDDYWSHSFEPTLTEGLPPERLRIEGVLPVSALQLAADTYVHWALTQRYQIPFTALRARTDDATYARLLKLVTGSSPVRGAPETIALAERLGVLDLAGDFAEGKKPVLTRPAELAYLCFLEERENRFLEAEVDWAAVSEKLQQELAEPPPDFESAEPPFRAAALLRAYLRTLLRAPRGCFLSLLRATRALDNDWSALVLWGVLRAANPVLSASAVHIAFGSTLALHHARNGLDDLKVARNIEDPSPWRPTAEVLSNLLVSGAGTLRRMDYPAFRLVVRPSISIVPQELASELAELSQNLVWRHGLFMAALPFETLLARLFENAECSAFRRLPDAARRSLARALEENAIAYVTLKAVVFADEPIKIRKKHIRAFAGRKEDLEKDPPKSFAELGSLHGLDLAKEGLCHALLGELHEKWTDDAGLANALKEGFIGVTRGVAQTSGQPYVHIGSDAEEPSLRAARLSQFLHLCLVDAPFEVAVALGLEGGNGLPRLAGGRLPESELRFRRAMRKISGSVRTTDGSSERHLECRPISKAEAIHRSKLGADCSTGSVPYRALSPHHVYYGFFEGGQQRSGYMTVYEAWADLPSGEKAPVLCLETINVPLDSPDSALLDIARIFESIACARGLYPGLVLITNIGTWNFQSGALLAQSRRFRRGAHVTLHPADPVTWKLYETIGHEARYYSAFSDAPAGSFRLLAPHDPDLDFIQPENEEEARRLRSSPKKELIVTAHSASGPLGFISGLPEIL